MKIKGLKKVKEIPERVKSRNGNVYETGEMIPIFKAPDGFKAPYDTFVREIERGRLHGCLVASS